MNRPDYVAKLLSQIGETEELRPYLDTVMVMEQGTQLMRDSEFYPAAEKSLGDKLRVIEQGNLGGSGGYARGQLESVAQGHRDLRPDDGRRRRLRARGHHPGRHVRRPGQAPDDRRRPHVQHLQALPAAQLRRGRAALALLVDDAASTATTSGTSPHRNLRSARWLHKRADVDFNGWFMCLIPRQVLEEIGLSLPLFIKWDDSEFGLRAKEAGFPTVSFPGAAVWHIPWTDKNDGLDWQSYFHQRNRFVAALLHSTYPHGGRMVRESLNHQIKHLVSMQYATVEMRHRALEDVLAGPYALHGQLATKLGEVNALAKQFSDMQLKVDRDDLPAGTPEEAAAARPATPARSRAGLSQLVTAGLAPIRQLRPVRRLAQEFPEAELHRDGRAVVPPGVVRLGGRVDERRHVGGALPARPRAVPRPARASTLEIHERFRREWPRLAAEYRAALGDITSPEAWDETFRPWTEVADDEYRDGTARERHVVERTRPTPDVARVDAPAAAAVGRAGAARGLPAPLHPDPAGTPGDRRALPGLGAGPGLVLRQPADPVLHLLLRDGDPVRPGATAPRRSRSTCSRA